MTAAEVRTKINTEFAALLANPDLDREQLVHARSVKNWALLLAPRIAARSLEPDAIMESGPTTLTGEPTTVALTASPASGFLAIVFSLLTTFFANRPMILAIITGIEGLLTILGLL